MPATNLSEQELVLQLQEERSRDKAFRVLVLQYQERLYWHVRKIVKSHDDTNDVVQNSFIKIYRNIDKFKGDSKLYTWLYRIATNEALTFLKKQQRRTTEAIDNPDMNLANQLSSSDDIDGDVVQQLLQKAIETLPEKQKLVFNMRYFQEIPYQDISEILGTSVGALKASYHHAAKKIETFVSRSFLA